VLCDKNLSTDSPRLTLQIEIIHGSLADDKLGSNDANMYILHMTGLRVSTLLVALEDIIWHLDMITILERIYFRKDLAQLYSLQKVCNSDFFKALIKIISYARAPGILSQNVNNGQSHRTIDYLPLNMWW